MKAEVTDNDRMALLFHKLIDFNEHIKATQMKEQIKMYGICAEIFEDDLVPFVARILKNLEKVINSESTMRLHAAISETVGNLVFHIVDKIGSDMEKMEFFDN